MRELDCDGIVTRNLLFLRGVSIQDWFAVDLFHQLSHPIDPTKP